MCCWTMQVKQDQGERNFLWTIKGINVALKNHMAEEKTLSIRAVHGPLSIQKKNESMNLNLTLELNKKWGKQLALQYDKIWNTDRATQRNMWKLLGQTRRNRNLSLWGTTGTGTYFMHTKMIMECTAGSVVRKCPNIAGMPFASSL